MPGSDGPQQPEGTARERRLRRPRPSSPPAPREEPPSSRRRAPAAPGAEAGGPDPAREDLKVEEKGTKKADFLTQVFVTGDLGGPAHHSVARRL